MLSQSDKLLGALENGILSVDMFKQENNEASNILNYVSKQGMKNYLGSGALGTVYSLNKDTVAKINNPCGNNKIYSKYCQDLLEYVNEKTPFTVIPSGEKLRYIIPNLLTESIISMYLGKASPNFAKTSNCYIVEERNASCSSFFGKECKFSKLNQNKKDDVTPMNIEIDKKEKKMLLKTSTSSKVERNVREYATIPGVISIMDKYVSIFDKNSGQLIPIINPVNFLCLIYQVAAGLAWAQSTYRFTHYDLHIDNVLIAPITNFNNLTILKYENLNMLSSQCPFIVKIGDFGLSRMETGSIIITPTISDFPDGNFGEFNYSYDFMSFLGSIMMDYRLSYKFYPLFDKFSDLYFFLVKLMIWYLNEEENLAGKVEKNVDKLKAVLRYLADNYYSRGKNGEVFYRPKMVDRNLVKYYNTKTMHETVNYLTEFLLRNNIGVENKNLRVKSPRSRDNVINMPVSRPFSISKIVPFATNIPKPTNPQIENLNSNFVEMEVSKNDNIKVRTYRIIYSSPPNDFNFTLDQKQIDLCPLQEHYMTAMFISPGVKSYRYTSECCMIDPVNFIRNRNFTGFVVNGGYFNIGKDYLPVGPYKDRNVISREGSIYIPSKYSDVYGFVMMKDDQLIITRDEKLIKNYEYGFSTGPFLIENGEIVFDVDDERFACTTSNNISNKFTDIKVLGETNKDIKVSGYVEYEYNPDTNRCLGVTNNTEKVFPRCDKIEPGELSHANNPNPRTVVFTLKDGSVVFLTVEGRGNRGIGIDLYTLSQAIKQTFPDVVTAINLDGGRSSNIAWRSESDHSTVYISNPDHMYQYPVGNVIVFGKKY